MATRKAAVRRKTEGAYHHGDLRAALKAAALELVQANGPRAFSLNEASRLAGVTVGAPYRHFADRDALLAELAAEGFALLEGEVRQAAAGMVDARERVVAAGMAYLHFATRHPAYFAVMFQAGLAGERHPVMMAAGQRAFGALQEMVRAGVAEAGEAERRAVMAWGLVHGLALLDAEGVLRGTPGGSGGAEGLRGVLEEFVGLALKR